MGFGNLAGDVEPQPQPLLARASRHAKEGLEQTLQGRRRDRLAVVRDGELKGPIQGCGTDQDRLLARAMGEGIRHQVVSTFSSPPGWRPNWMSSRTAQAIQRSSVTRATAAKSMPVVRQTTSRRVGTAWMRSMAARSASKSVGTSERSPDPGTR